MAVIVSDTSPIRALAHLGHLELLQHLFAEVLVPPAVVAELERPLSKLPPLGIQQLPFVRVVAPRDRVAVQELRVALGPGEAEAIALALEVRAEALLIDEATGRAVARTKGLSPLGVLGVLVRAKQRGLIGPVAPLMDQLRSGLGFFISDELRRQVLNQAGE